MLGLGTSITHPDYIASGSYMQANGASIGLQLWLPNASGEFSDVLTLNGSDISQWGDRSGNNNHARQTTASFQPAAADGGADFTSDNADRLDLSSNLALTQFHIFMVLELDSLSNETIFGNAGDSGEFIRIVDANSYRHKASAGTETVIFDYTSGKTISTGTKFLYEIFRDTDSIEVFVDGDHFTASPASGSNTSNPSKPLTINQIATQRNNAANADGHIYEVAIFNEVLTGDTLTNVRNEINTRNGL